MDLFVVWALDITNTRFFHSYTIHPLLGSNIPLIGLRSNKKKLRCKQAIPRRL